MSGNEKTAPEVREAKRQKTLEELCPFDDVLFRCMIKDNYPLASRIIRTVLRDPNLVIVSLKTQVDMKRLAGSRSLCLDVVTVTVPPGTEVTFPIGDTVPPSGTLQNLEVEGSVDNANPYRARYHSSVLDVENLKSGQDFKELPTTWVIFITKEDYFGDGKAYYRVERAVFNENAKSTKKLFDDHAHILYINGAYDKETGRYADIARLMRDFHTTDPDAMHFPEMADTMRRFKRTEGG